MRGAVMGDGQPVKSHEFGTTVMETIPTPGQMHFSKSAGDTLRIDLTGNWTIGAAIPSALDAEKEIEANQPLRTVAFDAAELSAWDSGLLVFLLRILHYCGQRHIAVDQRGLPQGVQRLLRLALAVPEKEDARRQAVHESFLADVGKETLNLAQSSGAILDFIGEASLAFLRFLGGKTRFRRVDLMLLIQECGAQALPIVTLISILVGLILAFVGAVQLKMFGAQIYVADLVGIAMAREMGAMMTGIIMAGRTGAAFAAQLGTMQVNEEIDALKTLGISPMEFLVMPRMIALVLMMPLLCIYADFMGILGGLLVGIGMLDLSFMEYLNETREALTLTHFSVGIFKGVVFGVLVALSGCLRGMQCGRSSSAVGLAATSAVVTAIVAIIMCDGLFAIITNTLGI
jgi:phospholipid/cholesterol/gamma-HCH transport system permease protein